MAPSGKVGGKGKATFKVKNKVQNKEKRQRYRQDSKDRRAEEADRPLTSTKNPTAGKPVEKKKKYLEPPSSEHSVKLSYEDISFFQERSSLLSKFASGNSLNRLEVENRKDAKKRKADEMNEIREKGNAILYGTANHSDDDQSDDADSQNGDVVADGSDASEEMVDSEADEDLNDSDDEEPDVAAKYENSLRKGAWQKDEKKKERLPVKSAAGKLIKNVAAEQLNARADSDDEKPSPIGPTSHSLVEEDVYLSEDELQMDDDHNIEVDRDYEDDSDMDSDADSNDAARAAAEAAAELEMDPEVRQMMRVRHVTEVKVKLASAASAVLENPEENITRLEDFASCFLDSDPVVRQLAILSATETYKDIVPGYRIRLPTAAEANSKISKDVRALRKFESSLLGAYQRFIHFLLACLQPLKMSLYQKLDGEKQVAKRMKKKRRVLVAKGLSHEQAEKIVSMEQQSQSSERVAVAAANALARLLSSIPHFNYTKDIITHTVPLINHSNEQVSAAVASACQSVFVNDVAGQVTVEIMRLLGKLAKEKPMHLSPKLLTTFLHLKLQHNIIYLGMEVDDKNAARIKKRENETKGDKKKRKAANKELDREIDKDLQEGEAEIRDTQKQRVQRELLDLVFATYFRILKTNGVGASSKTLPVVLKGLAKFAHLINIGLVVDTLTCLRTLVSQQQNQLSTSSALHCIIAAFETLSGPGQSLTMEMSDFYSHLFNYLWRLTTDHESCENTDLMLQALSLMFIRRRVMSLDVVAAFVKRLATISTCLLPHQAIGILAMIRALVDKYPRVQQLLENEPTPIGIFRGEIDDPTHANAFATSAWELTLLRNSYHPFVVKLTGIVLNNSELPAQVARISPNALLSAYDCSAGGFMPPVQGPPQNNSTKVYKSLDSHKVSSFVEHLQKKQLFQGLDAHSDDRALEHFSLSTEARQRHIVRKQIELYRLRKLNEMAVIRDVDLHFANDE